MSASNKDFFGKEVADAIKAACNSLQVAQEELNIEVVETGSTGIFGLIRKKAHIRVVKKSEVQEPSPLEKQAKSIEEPVADGTGAGAAKEELQEESAEKAAKEPEKKKGQKKPVADTEAENVSEKEELDPESIEIVKKDLEQMLLHMGFPSEVSTTLSGNKLHCHIRGDHEDDLTGQDGKILDSLQYLMRKIVTRKISMRLRLTIDVGDYREKREQELIEKALALAVQVKEDGKTQAIPALNPSERRFVHMTLQDDKEIRSRSVGDGLFKKILIYKPGKGKKGGGKRRPSNRKRPRNTRKKSEKSE